MHLLENRTVKVVKFETGAELSLDFESALKCWRIHKPNVISVENQNLNDDHIHQLCEFLKDKNMVCQLNLRRNLITNKGAEEIASLLTEHDN